MYSIQILWLKARVMLVSCNLTGKKKTSALALGDIQKELDELALELHQDFSLGN